MFWDFGLCLCSIFNIHRFVEEIAEMCHFQFFFSYFIRWKIEHHVVETTTLSTRISQRPIIRHVNINTETPWKPCENTSFIKETAVTKIYFLFSRYSRDVFRYFERDVAACKKRARGGVDTGEVRFLEARHNRGWHGGTSARGFFEWKWLRLWENYRTPSGRSRSRRRMWRVA